MTTPTAIPAHIQVSPGALAPIPSATLVGEHDGHVRVTGSVESSATFRGMFLVETEVGSLYLDADLPVTIVNPELSEDDDLVAFAHTVGLLQASRSLLD
ncbi:hypothetical protein HBA53_23800 (plasmid) [Rhodococcus pyridinivorans]|uniref:hypothetical protein n=1 Tax=Rhodococcus TaxID=1827 RepID=UPI001C305D36|nr:MULTISPECIES: hypothetical protein [Rhodococcus]MBX4170943.1 hypothetical protein [Rhodococcus sp. DMU2021]QXF84139.1 hypothetical protein HBA53_23800 [Rhodococcus pyridinivorans]